MMVDWSLFSASIKNARKDDKIILKYDYEKQQLTTIFENGFHEVTYKGTYHHIDEEHWKSLLWSNREGDVGVDHFEPDLFEL